MSKHQGLKYEPFFLYLCIFMHIVAYLGHRPHSRKPFHFVIFLQMTCGLEISVYMWSELCTCICAWMDFLFLGLLISGIETTHEKLMKEGYWETREKKIRQEKNKSSWRCSCSGINERFLTETVIKRPTWNTFYQKKKEACINQVCSNDWTNLL